MGCGTSRTTTTTPCNSTAGSFKEEEGIRTKSLSEDENSSANCSAYKKNMDDQFAHEDAGLGKNSFEVKSNEILDPDQQTGEQISSLLANKEIGSTLIGIGSNNKERRSLETLSEGIQQCDNDNISQCMINIPREEENFVTIVNNSRGNLFSSSEGIVKPHPITYDSKDFFIETAADSRMNVFETSSNQSSSGMLKPDKLSFNSRGNIMTVANNRTSVLGPIYRETSDASARFILGSQPSLERKSVKYITHLGNSCTSPAKLLLGPLGELLEGKEIVIHRTELKSEEQPGENGLSKLSPSTLDNPLKVPPVNPQSQDYLEFERKVPVSDEALQTLKEGTQKPPQFSNESYIQANSLEVVSAPNSNENLVYVSRNINEEVLNQPVIIPRSVKQQPEVRILRVS